MSSKELAKRIKKATGQTPERIKKAIVALEKERFIIYNPKKKELPLK